MCIYIETYIYIYIYHKRESYIRMYNNYTQAMEKQLKNKHNINKPMKHQRNTKQIRSKP